MTRPWIAFVMMALCSVGLRAGPQGDTAVMTGRVMLSTSASQPVRRAIVQVSGGDLTRSRSVVTGEDGRFSFEGLGTGRFTLAASKAGHVTTAYGSKRVGGPGTPIALTAGQQMTDLVLPLVPGAVITGTVRDRTGETLPGVSMIVGRVGLDRPGAGQSAMLGSITTDDRGMFRVYGLEPGTYMVGATVRSGGQAAISVPTEAELTDRLGRVQRRTGATAGAPAQTTGAAAGASGAPDAAFSIAPIFFGNTPSISEATPVTVNAGDERGGIDIVFSPARAGRIEGVVVSPDGPLSPVQLGFASAVNVQLPGLSNASPTLSLSPGPDGRFIYTGVLPGRYVITARTGQVTLTPGGFSVTGGGGGGPVTNVGRGAGIEGNPGSAAWASAEVLVTSGNVSPLTLMLQPAIVIPGSFRFEGDRTPPATPAVSPRLTTYRGTGFGVSAASGIFGTVPPPPATPTGTNTFEFRNVMPGTFQFTAQAPDGWWLRAAIAGGHDLLDLPLDIDHTGGGVTPIELIFSDRHTELSGRLQTRAGDPAADYVVVMFTTNPSLWRPQARRMASTRPATDGAFSIADLPPGEYYLAALTDLDPLDWQTPEFLSQIAPAALKVTLGDGEKRRQDLAIAR